MAPSPIQQAKWIVTEGLSFTIAAAAGLFPPRDVANSFFACGCDDRRGNDESVLEWKPFQLAEDEYRMLVEWWQMEHPDARVERLGLPESDFSPWFSKAARQAR
jgi:hypothetical protein